MLRKISKERTAVAGDIYKLGKKVLKMSVFAPPDPLSMAVAKAST